MTGRRLLIIGISAATGTCFAVLAGLSISAMAFPFRRFQPFSLVIAAVALCLGYVAFRAAIVGKTSGETLVASLYRGIVGAFVGFLVISAFLLMFGADTRAFLAHALGRPATGFTIFRLLLASALLGFGTGFVVRMPKLRPREANGEP